jgi:hypothetical protein
LAQRAALQQATPEHQAQERERREQGAAVLRSLREGLQAGARSRARSVVSTPSSTVPRGAACVPHLPAGSAIPASTPRSDP